MTFPLLGWWGWEGDTRIITCLGMDPKRADFHGGLSVQYILDCAFIKILRFRYFTKRKELQFCWCLILRVWKVRDISHPDQSKQSLYVCVCVSMWFTIAVGRRKPSYGEGKRLLVITKWKANRADSKTKLFLLLVLFQRKS